MIHVSDLLHFEKCPYLLWNQSHHRLPYESFYHMDHSFFEYWMSYFQFEDYALGQVGDSNSVSLAHLEKKDILIQGRFSYRDCRTKIPILKKIENGYLAIYPFLSAYPKDTEARMMKVNQMILAHLGIHITQHKILYLNKNYKRGSTLDISSLFLYSDRLFNKKNKETCTIQECIGKIHFDLDAWIDQTQLVMNRQEFHPDKREKRCTSGRRCLYYPICFDDTKLPDDSVLFLTTSSKKLKAYDRGISHLKDFPVEDLEGFRLQYAQYKAAIDGSYVDRLALSTWLNQIHGPISYLDFEWDTFAIPPYKNMKPFDVLCFQYSLHIEQEDGTLDHHDFFDYGDCRESFICSLIHNIPKTGSILVYNMEGAEKLRLKQLADQFPSYSSELEQIYSRMVDLSKPFESGLFYDNRMRGHYSLKNILPIFTEDVSYTDLTIHDGLQAVKAYRNYEHSDESLQAKLRQDIRKYCQMDTFAEYVVYHGLLNIK